MEMIYSFRIDPFIWDKFEEECKKIGKTKSKCLRRAIVWVYRNNYYKFTATRLGGKTTSIVIDETLDDLIKTYAKYKGIYRSDVARLAILAFLTEEECKKFVGVKPVEYNQFI
jgi:hypothetical protein